MSLVFFLFLFFCILFIDHPCCEKIVFHGVSQASIIILKYLAFAICINIFNRALSQKGIMSCANSIIMLIYFLINCTTTNIFVDGEGLQLSIKVNMTYLAWYRKIVRSSLGKISCDEQLDSLLLWRKVCFTGKREGFIKRSPQVFTRGYFKRVQKKQSTVIALFCSKIIETLRQNTGSALLNHNK